MKINSLGLPVNDYSLTKPASSSTSRTFTQSNQTQTSILEKFKGRVSPLKRGSSAYSYQNELAQKQYQFPETLSASQR
jgi:hypothetical protein